MTRLSRSGDDLSKKLQHLTSHVRELTSLINDKVWLANVGLKFGAKSPDEPLHIVTGADSSHAQSLRNLLRSIAEHEPLAQVTIWDLGLSEDERALIELENPDFDLVRFDFSRYPSHLDISKDAGVYAWKPVIISESARGSRGLVVWLDAGNLLIGELKYLRRIVFRKGFFSPYSQGTVGDWTSPGTLDALGADGSVVSQKNCNGAVVAFDRRQEQANRLLKDWVRCALDVNCIAPTGANLSNHRFDQAVLTVLAAQQKLNGNAFSRNLRRPMGILIHQDVE